MGVKITLDGIKAGGNTKVLRNAKIRSTDAELILRDLTVDGNAEILENLDIDDFCNEVMSDDVLFGMSPEEYISFQKVIKHKNRNRSTFLNSLFQHLLSFSEGVIASVVASFLTQQR